MDLKFYRCKNCGNIIAFAHSTGASVICCGEEMEEIVPNTSDGDKEKHVPVYEVKDGVVSVKIGSKEHPMGMDHYIEWVAIRTCCGNQRKVLTPGGAPEVKFHIGPQEKVKEVLAYCNIHGLFKA